MSNPKTNPTPRLLTAIKAATKESAKLGIKEIPLDFVLHAVITQRGGGILPLFITANAKSEDALADFMKKASVSAGPELKKDEVSNSSEIEQVLIIAKDIRDSLSHDYVGTEHFYLASMRFSESNPVKLVSELTAFGVDMKAIAVKIHESLAKNAEAAKIPATAGNGKEEQKKAGELLVYKFASELVEKASKGEIDPVVGRTEEVSRVIKILSRKKKNNPILVGPAGVGKTAIAEGLAQRIHDKSVPVHLQSKKIFALDMSRVVAGTTYRGQFEERLKTIIDEVKANKDFIVFIDEIHAIIGAGSSEGGMDAVNILKPALARGEFSCIGATTLDEYRKYIERDPALERRFQQVSVEEPSDEDTFLILKGAAKSYEKFHGVVFPEEVLRATVSLSNRYIIDRFQPDKAFDVIDEAGAAVKLTQKHDLKEKTSLEEALTKAEANQKECIASGDYEKAAAAKKDVESAKHSLNKILVSNGASNVVSVENVQEIISSWSGVPVGSMSESAKEKISHIDSALSSVVIGQETAVAKVSQALKKSKTPLKNPKRPIGSFLFVGPTGVGKTLLAERVAVEHFDSDKNFLRLDMSEYADAISMSKLIGASAGYVGYEEGGKLCKFVRTHPYSVVLFDEIEKAHSDVSELLLQILENGAISDNKGRLVDFKNTIVICTSNAGAEESKSLGFGASKDNDSSNMLAAISKILKPEMIGRFDVVSFKGLSTENVRKVIGLEVDKISAKLSESNIKIELDESAVEFLVGQCYNEKLGARNLRAQVETHIEDALVDEILSNKICNNATVVFSIKDKKLIHEIK